MAASQHTGNPGNFAEDREKAARAGHIGGQHSSGNFANDRDRAVQAGRKGGQMSHGPSRSHGASGTDRSGADATEKGADATEKGAGNFADDRNKASEAGRKGGSR